MELGILTNVTIVDESIKFIFYKSSKKVKLDYSR